MTRRLLAGTELLLEPALHQPGDLLIGVGMRGDVATALYLRPEAHYLVASQYLHFAEGYLVDGEVVEVMDEAREAGVCRSSVMTGSCGS